MVVIAWVGITKATDSHVVIRGGISSLKIVRNNQIFSVFIVR
jgi:hypothetical protein